MIYRLLLGMYVSLILGLMGCKEDPPPTPEPEPEYIQPEIPAHFPEMNIPEDNRLTLQRVALGKKLFFDPLLSRDRTVSCGSCHQPERAFSDDAPVSPGVGGRTGKRNAPSLINIAWANSLNWDGGVPTLETQALVPIQDHNELDMDFETLIERLSQHPEYPALFDEAYGRGPDTFTIVRALSAFQRTLIGGRSAYDRYIQGDSSALSASAKRGKQLFFSEEAECFHCHGGVFFSDFTFQNNGLYAEYADLGRFEITGRLRDRGRFKVPSLRNVALTPPYMHDGSMETLEEVLEHYSRGGADNPMKSPLLIEFDFTEQEKADLIQFLESLTDEPLPEGGL